MYVEMSYICHKCKYVQQMNTKLPLAMLNSFPAMGTKNLEYLDLLDHG